MNINSIREDFPILSRTIYDKPLVYLDNAATTLKPKGVIEAISNYYSNETANVHRGVHFLSNQATDKFEACRKKVKTFINAKSESEIIFTKGTTDSINLVSLSYGENFLSEGDEILISQLEHHSNMVPWQILAKKKSLILKFIPLLQDGSLDLDKLDDLMTEKTKLLAVNYVSNSLGTINPVKDLIKKAKEKNIITLIDAAQAVLHFPVDVQDLDCDFFAFSSHKILGPTGLGVLYGRENLLEKMPPIFGGGDMIKSVRLEGSTWNDLPFKFEAGTPHIAGVIGLSAALDYINGIGFDFIQEQEKDLFEYAKTKLDKLNFVKQVAVQANKAPVFSFSIEGLHASDVATILDQQGIAIRSGHHCTMPVLEFFKVNSLARASFSFYNTKQDVDSLCDGLNKLKDFI